MTVMDGRRITANPRPSSGRRVVARKRPRGGVDGFVNSVKKLQRREICSKRGRAFSMCDAQERFRNIRLQEEYDTHDPKGHCPTVLPFLKKRSKIIEIVAAHDIVFALAQSGVCAAFNRETNKRICFLNVTPDEVIRSLFYNKNNDSLITVSVYASDSFSSLKCRTTRIEYIRRGQPDAGFALFESESLKWPGFVEFDDVNGKVLTFSAQDSIYKVFDLKNYMMLYSISDKNVQEIKISPGIMLLIFNKSSGHVPLKILSIEDGTVLKSFNHLLHRHKKVDFIEQFNEKLLVKQENENLQILDVRTSELIEVSRTEFMTPSAFIFLYENQLFLTFRNRTVAVWNFRGELVTSFEDHLLWHPDCNTNNIYITSDQDLIISYCKADSDDPLTEGNGSINISNILTGKCLAKVKALNNVVMDECSCSDSDSDRRRCKCKSRNRRIEASRTTEALEDITALFYDEDRSEIYTGNRLGFDPPDPPVVVVVVVLGGGGVVSSIWLNLVQVHLQLSFILSVENRGICLARSYRQRLVEMEGGINLDATLDYVEFHTFPSQNRYEVSVWSSNKEENLASGPLKQLLLHSPETRNLSSKDSNTKFKILPPDNINDASWFTIATLTRFLQIIGLSDVLSIGKEISQLEGTRNFIISSSDKSEILVAVDLRLTALKEELAAVLNKAISSKYSLKDISDLGNFALHFGAKALGDSLQKSVELSSIEDEDSSEEDELNTERSRGVTRSSMPKRSASPMRRIQIGRSGSRRTAALSIKSLNYFPGREKSTMPLGDDEEEEEEDSHRPVNNNVLRMSVQDKISLFESKQRDQGVVNVQKTTKSANKAVLRRWSSGMGEKGTTLSSPKNIDPDVKTETDNNNNNNSNTETCPEKGTTYEELGVEAEKFEQAERDDEWSQEKGFNDQNVTSDDSKIKISKEQKGEVYEDHDNKKREEKVQKQGARKRVEKSSSTNVSGAKSNGRHQQKTQKNTAQSQLINSKTTMKPSAIKKSTLNSSSLPTTRKSPQPATNRKPESPASSKVENLQPRLKTVKSTKPDGNTRIRATNIEKKHPTSTENKKTTTRRRTKVETPKKNSVVPVVETKPPFLRKGSRVGPVAGGVIKTRGVVSLSQQPVETSRTEATTTRNVDIMIINHDMMESSDQSETPKTNFVEPEVVECEQSDKLSCDGDLGVEIEELSGVNVTEEPKVEIYAENRENEIVPYKESLVLPRVRHSLSQMMLEESNESEWGNDSHPPTLVYQKDAPRGLKRLLKFARKTTKPDSQSHSTHWSSPEGEDDTDESKATRSFFSLSAFRGNKINETKILHR
ncbi:unnamed protein product [Lactuca virosa]|uniref:Uncharacterized protein n=1 Tax=Lactuca virosa TaxID=75947 RepID=A0AAU9NM24_9ASTR|nr:unnamed protein product [Lactuca virosa]